MDPNSLPEGKTVGNHKGSILNKLLLKYWDKKIYTLIIPNPIKEFVNLIKMFLMRWRHLFETIFYQEDSKAPMNPLFLYECLQGD